MFWLTAVCICMPMICTFIPVLVRRISTQLTVIWIELTLDSNVSCVILGLSIKRNKIDYVESATNLGIVFNDRFSWSSHTSVIVGMLRNLWTVIDSTPFAIRKQLDKTYLIPVLLYGCEIFANCDSHDNRKLNLAYNNVARYVFLKARREHISHLAYQIFGVKFENILKIKWCLILFHKIVNMRQAEYIGRIKPARSC